MARLWSCGFELQTVGSGGTGVEWDTTTGSPTINTSTVRSGAASLRCNPSGATAYIQHAMQAADAATRMYLRAYVYIATLPSAKTMIVSWTDSSPFGYGIVLQTNGTIKIEGTNGTLQSAASATTLSTGTWYRIELDMDDNNDIATAYINGVQECQLTSADVFGGHLARFGVQFSCTTDIYFDDLAVNDTSGSTQNGLPGSGKIVHLKPNAQGDNNGFATAVGGTAGAANNYTRVSETTPDDLTSYNNTTATGTTTIDDFNVTDSSGAGIGPSDTITLVQVGQRAGSNAATTASIVTRIKAAAAGTVAESASIPVNVNGWNTHANAIPKLYRLTAYVKPSSTAWTPSDIDSMQIGYRGNVSQSTQRRITTLWALVEYVAAATDIVTSGTAALTVDAYGTNTSERITSGTAGLTITATAQTHNPDNDRVTSGTAGLIVDARASVTTNRTTSGRAGLTITARASTRSGSGSAYVWAPDLNPAPTDLELTIQARRDDDWRPADDQVLMSKWGNADGKRSWYLYVDADGGGDPSLIGRPVLAWTPTGDEADLIEAAADSRPPIDPFGTVTLRALLDVNNGSGSWQVTFQTQDEAGIWEQLGDAIVGSGTTSLYDPASIEDYEIGARDDGTEGRFVGRVYYATIRDGSAGALLASPDFTIWPSGTTTFSDETGLEWSVASPARLVSSQRLTSVAIVGPLATAECATYQDWSAPRTGVGLTCDHHPDLCCSYYEVRTVARVDGALLVSNWVPTSSDDSCLTWADEEHLIRTEGPDGPMWAAVGGLFNWDRDRPFTAAMGVNGTRFVTSAAPGGRNMHLTAAVESEADLQTLLAILDRPLVLLSPSDADEVWASPVAASAQVIKIGRIRQVTADFIATGPEPSDQHADVG